MPWSENRPEISLIIPVFQAIHCIDETLAQLDKLATNPDMPLEVILVDDGSTDGSGAVLLNYAQDREAVKLIVHPKNQGKGKAVADGVAAAAGNLIIFTDVDLPYDLEIIGRVQKMAAVAPYLHFFVGSRRHSASKLERPYTFTRKFFSWIFNRLARPLVSGATDMQCGFKCFRADVARVLFSNLKVARYAFDVELFMRAQELNLQFQELPVIFRHTPRSTVKWWSATPIMLRDLMRLYAEREKKN